MATISLSEINELLWLDEEYVFHWKYTHSGTRSDRTAGSVGANGYISIYIRHKNYYAHRLIYQIHHNMEIIDGKIDHIDRNRLNNNPNNLRLCTQSENASNRTKQANNSSGFKGVSYRKDRNRWLAKITKNGKPFHLGLFMTADEAAMAYKIASIEIHGDFSIYKNID